MGTDLGKSYRSIGDVLMCKQKKMTWGGVIWMHFVQNKVRASDWTSYIYIYRVFGCNAIDPLTPPANLCIRGVYDP